MRPVWWTIIRMWQEAVPAGRITGSGCGLRCCTKFRISKSSSATRCVGCGRCDDICPEYTSFSACVNRVARWKRRAWWEQARNIPILSQILKVKKHTDIEYTFSMSYTGRVKPGQFFEVSIPRYGEAPISVSGIRRGHRGLNHPPGGEGHERIFERYEGRQPVYEGPFTATVLTTPIPRQELVIVAGGTGVSPVRGVIRYFRTTPWAGAHVVDRGL